MQTPIPSPTRSPRKNLSSDKTISQELMETVSPSTATTSKAQCKTRRISSNELWKVHGKVDKVLYEIIPQIAEKDTKNVIEGNLKRIMADIVIQERDALQAEVPALVLKEFIDQTPQIIEELFKSYVSTNVIQVHPTTSTSTSTTSFADL
ncbi:hypothetical protein Tco_0985385 [Tanacetum coccineum]